MNKYIFSLLIIMGTSGASVSLAQLSQEQQGEVDSLDLVIKENNHDTTVAQAFVQLASILYVSKPDTMIPLCEKAISIVDKNLKKSSLSNKEKRAFHKISAIAINNIGFVHHFHADYSKALEHFMAALKIYEDINDKEGIAESYIGIGAMYNFLGDVDKALEYYQEGLRMGEEQGFTRITATALNNIGYIHKNQGDYQLALKYYQRSLKLHQEVGDKPNIANTYNNIGALHRNLGEYTKALEYLAKGLKIQEEIGYKKGIASTYGNMGHIYNLQGDIAMALEYYHKALKIREEIGEKSSVALSLSSIGSIYKNQRDTDLALDYYRKALKIHVESGEQRRIAISYNDIGLVYKDKGDLNQALEYFQQALTIEEELKDNPTLIRTLNHIGEIYLKQDNYALALEYFQRSLDISEKIGEKIGIARSNLHIGTVYEGMENNTWAIQYGRKGLVIARELGAVKEIEMASELLFKGYKNTNQYRDALQMHELFIEMRDSLVNEENTRAIIVNEMNYKHQKELQAERLALAEQKHKEELIQQKKNQMIYGGFSLLTIFGLFGYFIIRYRARKKELLRQKKHNEKLKHVDKLKDQFLANTSHELRTPLQGIIGLSESLFEREKEKGKRQELAMITSSGKRLSSLVNSILDFSKLKTHELKLSKKAIDIRTLIDVVINISQPLIKGKPIKLINEVDPSTPLIKADEDRMYQIMHNLIGNAIKFTNDGYITISALEKQEVVQITVKDTGIGIPEDKIDNIFKSFEQVDASITREHGGTGLGLTITKQLIELHGGNIWVESQVDQGTIMYFTLPKSTDKKTTISEQSLLSKVSESLPVEEDVTKHSFEEEQPAAINNKFNILIVDDEPINQQVLSNHLSKYNFRILHAMNGQEALDLLEKKKLDLVLLDIMMPKMSGYEVCREIRKKYMASELPVIMITAKDQVTDLVEGLASGANDYLSKPFSRDELLARLKTHLNLYNINTAYLRFIPKEFIRALGHDSIIDVELGDQVKGEMTILFSDIRSFTTLTEKLSAKESFEFLNDFLNCITPAVTSNSGFIDKYIGDAVMALFPFKPEDALVAAIEAQNNLSEYNKSREKRGEEIIKIGIGIHTGPLMMGTIGVKNRMDGTVISDAVNLASRLEELNKLYGTTLIISEETVNKLEDPNKYNYRFLSKVSVKGKQQSNRIYEFFDGDADHDKSMKQKTLLKFQKGIEEYYNKRFTQASVLFQKVLDKYPEDKTTRILLEHSAKYMVQGVPKDWDGVDIVEKVF